MCQGPLLTLDLWGASRQTAPLGPVAVLCFTGVQHVSGFLNLMAVYENPESSCVQGVCETSTAAEE